MPRRPANLPEVTLQVRFRDRLVEEMEHFGYKDASIALRASEHYPVTANTIWKIKNSEPARRIDLDEAMAIARGLGHPDLESFLRLDRHRELEKLTAAVFAQTVSPARMVEEVLDGYEARLKNILLLIREAARDRATRARLERNNTRLTQGEAALVGMDPLLGMPGLLDQQRASIEERLDRVQAALADYRTQYLDFLAQVNTAAMVLPSLEEVEKENRPAMDEEP